MSLEEKIAANQGRVNKLAQEGLTIDFTPPRIEHLTDQVFNETWETLQEWELAWQDKVTAILDDIEPEVAKAKLMAGKGQMPGQLSLV